LRYAASDIGLRDQIGTDLTGDHSFSRLNAAGGFTLQIGRAAVYGSYSSASRVPTPSELSCADPDDPCRLPNAFVSDPPLEQVVAGTWEGGLRGSQASTEWTAAVFHTTNRDDIIFISSGALTNEGHFENVGDTRRRGLELTANGPLGPRLRWTAAYTFLDATFLTPLTLSSPNHPNEVAGEIAVPAGASLPSTPRHNVKLGATAAIAAATIGADLRYTSSQYFRGDEANLLDPIDGFAVIDLSARYRLGSRAALIGEVSNLFGAEYATFGLFGEADEVLGDGYEDPRFLGPGAPRAAWIGVEFSFR
jgi:outer membrane receptor protein involved in Fe transport